jgi:hypothetical protein
MLRTLLRFQLKVERETRPSQFDWELAFAPRQNPSSDTDPVSITTSLEEQLGLALKARRSTLDVIVITTGRGRWWISEGRPKAAPTT